MESKPRIKLLFIGNWNINPEDWGAVQVLDLNHALQISQKYIIEAISVTTAIALEKKFQILVSEQSDELSQLPILVRSIREIPISTLIELKNKYHIFLFCFEDELYDSFLVELLEKSSEIKQKKDFANLVKEQSLQYEKTQQELEIAVEKRTKSLNDSRAKLLATNIKIELLRKALIHINQSTQIIEIEKSLNELLAQELNLVWIKIIPFPHDQLFRNQVIDQLNYNFLDISLNGDHQNYGSIFFLKAKENRFSSIESNFLNKLTETLLITLNRIKKFNELETIREQWQLTFKSMKDQIFIIDENYNIVQSNSTHDSQGKKCYEILFNKHQPCSNCLRGVDFELNHDDLFYEVSSKKINTQHPVSSIVYVNFYKDTTQTNLLKNQIIESSNLAELGTIGSSIAHELNNPLGGMLSFTQLIKMDLPPQDKHYEDILEIEAGILRCKDIIDNLLGFTRSTSIEIKSKFTLSEAVDRAIKIIALKTKSMGIQIEVNLKFNISITGQLNLISQALKNILQNSADSLADSMKDRKIIITDFCEEKEWGLSICDNGKGMSQEVLKRALSPLFTTKTKGQHMGLGLPLSQQIIQDHSGKLLIISRLDQGTEAKISFSRPVLI